MYKCNMMCDHCPHDKDCDHIPLEERRVNEIMLCGNIFMILLLLFAALLICGMLL